MGRRRGAADRAPKSSDPDRSIRLVETLIDAVQPDELGLQIVLGECLDMLLGKKIRLQAPEDKFRQLCLGAVYREVPLRERQRLGLILGKLGDPRIVQDLRDPAAHVEIPAGQYAYQDGRQTVKTPFRISRYPVTNSQFALFIAEGGYENAAWWSEEGWSWREKGRVSEPEYWRNPKWNAPNQPVVGVSFWEAEAFCNWAGGRLPTEREWEAAARGPEGYEYPWGTNWENGICNTSEAGLGVTTPVGLFPRSRSQPFGLEDMAGNVLEWCADRYSQSDVGRVVRGGCWGDPCGLARSVYRPRDRPVYRNQDLGFRLFSAFSPGLK